MKLTENELQQLAKQLRCPDNNGGLQVVEMMNATNANIINQAIASLQLQADDSVLEIGPGNGSHIKDILNVTDVKYYGADISEAMVSECNSRFIDNSNVNVVHSDGNTIPFPDLTFTKIFTVNTIYFWENPIDYTSEIARVTKPGGLLSIGYIPKRIMQNIPFSKYGFTLYSEDAVRNLLENTGFSISDEITETELVTSNSSQQIEREFVIITAVKK